MTWEEFLYGDGVSVSRGLLGQDAPIRPLPPSTMTRQRRRADARAAAKGQR